MRRLAVLALTLLAAGCGGGGGGGGGLAGTYAVDVTATFGVPSAPTSGESPAAAVVRERFSPSAYRLDLLPGGLFSLSLDAGPEALRVDGTWVAVQDGVELVAITVNGAPATLEERIPDALRRVGDALVLDSAGGRPVVWRR